MTSYTALPEHASLTQHSPVQSNPSGQTMNRALKHHIHSPAKGGARNHKLSMQSCIHAMNQPLTPLPQPNPLPAVAPPLFPMHMQGYYWYCQAGGSRAASATSTASQDPTSAGDRDLADVDAYSTTLEVRGKPTGPAETPQGTTASPSTQQTAGAVSTRSTPTSNSVESAGNSTAAGDGVNTANEAITAGSSNAKNRVPVVIVASVAGVGGLVAGVVAAAAAVFVARRRRHIAVNKVVPCAPETA